MPAKTLSPHQLAEAVELAMLFKMHQHREKEAGREWTQEALAAKLGLNQSALNQYLTGRIPLNADFVLRVSELLGRPPREISPLVTLEQAEFQARWARASGESRPTVSSQAAQAAADFDSAPPEMRDILAAHWENVLNLLRRGLDVSVSASRPAGAAARAAHAPKTGRRSSP